MYRSNPHVEPKDFAETSSYEVVSSSPSIEPFERSSSGEWMYRFLCIISFGVVWYLSYFFPRLHKRIRYRSCALKTATGVLLEDTEHRRIVELDVRSIRVKDPEAGTDLEFRIFEINGKRYIYHIGLERFIRPNISMSRILNARATLSQEGLDPDTHRFRLVLYGSNMIGIVAEKFLFVILREAKRFIYVFQIFAIIALLVRGARVEYGYSILILLATICSLVLTSWQQWQQIRSIKRLSKFAHKELRVIRAGQSFLCGSTGLVPGDIVEITGRMTVPCDMVLVCGTVQVDESAVTGDPDICMKTGIPPDLEVDDIQGHLSDHMLLHGSRIESFTADANGKICAVVVHTGISTRRGEEIRNVLNAKEIPLPYESDAVKFIVVMFLAGLIGLLVALIRTNHESGLAVLFFTALIQLVPPILPAILSFSVFISQYRLDKENIFARNPRLILPFGNVDCVAFDKTGTLTGHTYSLAFLQAVTDGKFADTISASSLDFENKADIRLLGILASCHSLQVVNDQVIGDAMEAALHHASLYEVTTDAEVAREVASATRTRRDSVYQAVVDNRKVDPIYVPSHAIAVRSAKILVLERVYPYSAERGCSSVVVREPQSGKRLLFCKGSYRQVSSKCIPESVPTDLAEKVHFYAAKGYRVLECAIREWEPGRLSHSTVPLERIDCECDLTFAGLIVIENSLRPSSVPVVSELLRAGIRSIMVTGDLAPTAMAVASRCGIIRSGSPVLLCDIRRDEFSSNIAARRSFLHRSVEDGHNDQIGSRKKPALPRSPASDEDVQIIQNDPFLSSHARAPRQSASSFSSVHSFSSQSNFVDQDTVSVIWHRLDKLSEMHSEEDPQEIASFAIFPDDSAELAMTGMAFEVLRKTVTEEQSLLWKRLLVRTQIFCQMKPKHKALLMEDLRSVDYTVAMVGDGANDTAAMHTANVGVAVGESESANAPFIAQAGQGIECVTALIREGRCVLSTTLLSFTYMAMFAFMKYWCLLLLNVIQSPGFSQGQMVYLDLFIAIPTTFLFAWNKPQKTLHILRPAASLSSPQVITYVFSNVLMGSIFSTATILFFLERHTCFRLPFYGGITATGYSPPNTVTFLYAASFFLAIAIAFSLVPNPFRSRKNWILLIFEAFTLIEILVLLFANNQHFRNKILELLNTEASHSLSILGISGLNLVGAFLLANIIETVSVAHYLTRNRKNASRMWERIEGTLPSCGLRRLQNLQLRRISVVKTPDDFPIGLSRRNTRVPTRNRHAQGTSSSVFPTLSAMSGSQRARR